VLGAGASVAVIMANMLNAGQGRAGVDFIVPMSQQHLPVENDEAP